MPQNRSGAQRARPRAAVTVDTDQSDSSKAVQRADVSDDDDRELRQGDDAGDGVSEQERSQSLWLQRNRAVNKRLGRMQRAFDQKMADRDAEHQRELRGLRKQLDTLKRSRSEPQTDDAHEAAMKALQAQLDAANEAGDTAKVGQLTREIAKKEGQYWASKAAAASGTEVDRSERRGSRDEDGEEDDDQRPQGAPRPTPAGLAFTSANDWWDDPEFAAERGAANGIFGALVKEGGADPKDPKTYERVAKRLAKKFPNLEIVVPGRDDDDDDDDRDDDDQDDDFDDTSRDRRRAGAPVEGVRRRDDGGHQRRKRGTELTNADLDLMRKIGLNPDNDDHVLDMGRAAREVEEAEREQRGGRR